MTISKIAWAVTIAVIIAVAISEIATAQGMQGGMMQGSESRPGMMGPGMPQRGMSQGMMGSGMMTPGMMGGGMSEGQGMMCPMMSMMGSGMMQGMGQGTMGGGTGSLFGSRVTPMINLSVEDVRSYLGTQLERLNNKRLKIGNVSANEGTISADVVTVDNSLVQRLKVDRRTGAIEYEN